MAHHKGCCPTLRRQAGWQSSVCEREGGLRVCVCCLLLKCVCVCVCVYVKLTRDLCLRTACGTALPRRAPRIEAFCPRPRRPADVCRGLPVAGFAVFPFLALLVSPGHALLISDSCTRSPLPTTSHEDACILRFLFRLCFECLLSCPGDSRLLPGLCAGSWALECVTDPVSATCASAASRHFFARDPPTLPKGASAIGRAGAREGWLTLARASEKRRKVCSCPLRDSKKSPTMLSSAFLVEFPPRFARASAVLLPAEARFKAGDEGFALLLSVHLRQAESSLFFLSCLREKAFRCSTCLHSAHLSCTGGASTGRGGALHPPDRSIGPPAVRFDRSRKMGTCQWHSLLDPPVFLRV